MLDLREFTEKVLGLKLLPKQREMVESILRSDTLHAGQRYGVATAIMIAHEYQKYRLQQKGISFSVENAKRIAAEMDIEK